MSTDMSQSNMPTEVQGYLLPSTSSSFASPFPVPEQTPADVKVLPEVTSSNPLGDHELTWT